MSLTMDTPAFLRKFPRVATLNDGQQVTIRPLQSDDDTALHQFFLRGPRGRQVLPEQRCYLARSHSRIHRQYQP